MSSQAVEFYLSKLESETDPSVAAGASGYFSSPSPTLDPKLFDGTHLHPEVRTWVLDTLYAFWDQHYEHARRWSVVWAAGSGISYQWAANRGNGDLDILIGVDFARFYAYNPQYAGTPEHDMAARFNLEFHDELWPATASWNSFEVTWYVNPGATDIRAIHPYAAYNITTDAWTVHPPKLPAQPRETYSSLYWDAVGREMAHVRDLVSMYKQYKTQASTSVPGSPGWVNALTTQRAIVDRAAQLFDDIHLGRRNAFEPGGEGYSDYYNFRWQAHKEAGTIDALRDLRALHISALESAQQAAYGKRLDATDTLITRAALWNQHG